MMIEISAPARDIGEESAPVSSGTGADEARPPAHFVYDNEQIVPELLPARAEEDEERRRFVEGLRRLGGREVGLPEKRA